MAGKLKYRKKERNVSGKLNIRARRFTNTEIRYLQPEQCNRLLAYNFPEFSLAYGSYMTILFPDHDHQIYFSTLDVILRYLAVTSWTIFYRINT